MKRRSLSRYNEVEFKDQIDIGNGFHLEFKNGKQPVVYLFSGGTYVRMTELSDNFRVRLFLVDTVKSGVHKSKLAEAFKMSRQTIDNYCSLVNEYGVPALLNNAAIVDNQVVYKIDNKNKIPSNKKKALRKIRNAKKEGIEEYQMKINFTFGDETSKVEQKDQPFNEIHDWEETRYAGIFVYIMMLINKWNWFKFIMAYSGKFYKIFMIFLLMVSRNIGSIEQLKNVFRREGGIILGISKIPSIPYVWKCFYKVAQKRKSLLLLFDFFKYQINAGLVSMWSIFIDGHLLPYTGKAKVHYSYYTQRRIPYPGQTNLVSTDSSGKIVSFEIQEGLGDLKGHVLELNQRFQTEMEESPIMVFDREGYGSEFFHNLVIHKCSFVCWDKYLDKKKLDAIEDKKFTIEFELNGVNYKIFEGEKTFTYENADKVVITFTLRRIYIWNLKSNRRVCGLAGTKGKVVSSADCAQLILNRWGASENTFKHLGNRHPQHYRPGFKLTESENQEIANPTLKVMEKEISGLKKKLTKLNSAFAKCKPQFNKDGSLRSNSKYGKINRKRKEVEEKLKTCKQEKKNIPDRLNINSLENYKSFKKIDCEGKNLFDFVTVSIWNARKKMVEFLSSHIRENEVVDLFYAITNSHGKIKCAERYVAVKLEPVQQTKRCEAQKQLCRYLTDNCPQLPNGKSLFIEVDEKL